MLESFSTRHVDVVDVLSALHDSLRGYVESGKRMEDHLLYFGNCYPALLPTPKYVVHLIHDHYKNGILCLRDFLQTHDVCGPEKHYLRVKEAERCITAALQEVYGLADEQVVKNELRHVLSMGVIRDEIIRLRDEFKRIASDKDAFPFLNEYANLKEFDRRIRPVVVALELEALPMRQMVWRVEHFLHILYRKVNVARLSLGTKSEEKK